MLGVIYAQVLRNSSGSRLAGVYYIHVALNCFLKLLL